jgi:hypothetical protein
MHLYLVYSAFISSPAVNCLLSSVSVVTVSYLAAVSFMDYNVPATPQCICVNFHLRSEATLKGPRMRACSLSKQDHVSPVFD